MLASNEIMTIIRILLASIFFQGYGRLLPNNILKVDNQPLAFCHHNPFGTKFFVQFQPKSSILLKDAGLKWVIHAL